MTKRLTLENVLRRNYGKRLGIDRENRFFHIENTLPNLRQLQLSIKDEVLKLKDGIFFANLQTVLPTSFIVPFIVIKLSNCSHSVNNVKKHERQGDVKCR